MHLPSEPHISYIPLGISRRHLGTLMTLMALAGCDTYSTSTNSFEYKTSSKTSFAQISMDAYPPEITHAINHHINLAASQIPYLSTKSLAIQTLWGDYTSTAMLASYTHNPQNYFTQLGLPLDPHQRYPVLAALLGEQSQWNNAYTDSGLAPNQPCLILNRGLFIDDDISISSQCLKEWKHWFNQGYFRTNFHQSHTQANINEWLTINSGTPLLRQDLPPQPKLLCWDIWLCASAWDLLLVNSPSNLIFYSPPGISKPAEFFSLQGQIKTAILPLAPDMTIYELPLGDRLALEIFLPTRLSTMTEEHKITYAREFPAWQQRAVRILGTIPPLKPAGMMIMDLPYWQIQSQPYASVIMPAGTALPQLNPQAKLSSHTGQISLTISAGGVGPREFSAPRNIVASATTLPHISATVPFLYRIVDSSTGIIFFQGIMHNNYV